MRAVRSSIGRRGHHRVSKRPSLFAPVLTVCSQDSDGTAERDDNADTANCSLQSSEGSLV